MRGVLADKNVGALDACRRLFAFTDKEDRGTIDESACFDGAWEEVLRVMDDGGAQGEDGGLAAFRFAAREEGFERGVELFVLFATCAIEEAVSRDFGIGGVVGERAPKVLRPEAENFSFERFAEEDVFELWETEAAASLIDRAIDQPAEDVLATEADEAAELLLDGDRDVGTEDHRLCGGEPERGREDAGDAGDLVLFGDPAGGEKDVMAHDDVGLEGLHCVLHGKIGRLDEFVKERLDDEIRTLALVGEAWIVQDAQEIGLISEGDEPDADAADAGLEMRVGDHGHFVAPADQFFADGDVGVGIAGGAECCEKDAHGGR